MRTFLGLIVLAGSALANVTVSVSGTYDGSATPGTFEAPNASWTLSFDVANAPSAFGVGPTEFRTNFSNAVFKLNGTTIPVTGNQVIFSTIYSFNIFLDANTQFQAGSPGGPQLFSGSTSAPTMLAGSFANPIGLLAAVPKPGGSFFFSNSTSSAISIVGSAIPATPIPSTALLGMFGLAAVGVFLYKRA